MAERVGWLRTQILIALAHDTFWLEIGVAGVACAWAETVWWMPGDLADRTAYVAAAGFASDGLWDAMGCLGAAVQMAAAIRHSRVPRFLMAVLMLGFWLKLANGVARSVPAFTPSVVPYYGLAALNGLCAVLPLIRRLPLLRPG